MDFLNFNGNEAFSVWENVKESVKALSIKTNSKVSLDCSFVTPSILGIIYFDKPNIMFIITLNGYVLMYGYCKCSFGTI